MDDATKKAVLRKIPYGLYVAGVRNGSEVNAFTLTWVSQCSMSPPRLMLGIKHGSNSHDLLKRGGVISINFLGKDQQDLVQRFFKPAKRVGNKLGDCSFRLGVTGAPILDEAIAYFECEVKHFLEDAGDHSVAIVEIIEAGLNRDEEPLSLADTPWSYS